MTNLLDRMIDAATAATLCGVSDAEMREILRAANAAGRVAVSDRGEVRFGDVLSLMSTYQRDTTDEDARYADRMRAAARAGGL